ncbi:unnamed protein product [Prunus armeniaca]|uniref:Uncharacterized protein n=1 Tax=Prunus armeniaca TaxID=36596 RepID=A0A6J5UMF0_PRUAR|nr:unnamed protein product [Prunus armeniaca]CAB4301695.1 unnamed protein product [Prunus armeniaca]
MKFRIDVGTVRYASAGSNFLFYNLSVGHNAKMMGQKIMPHELILGISLFAGMYSLNLIPSSLCGSIVSIIKLCMWYRFHLLLWYKDDPKSQQKFLYYLARLKSKEVVLDSGTDIVCKTVYEFWFEEPTGSQTQFFGDGSSVPLEVAKNTEQIVEMLRRMPSHQLLVTLEEMAMQEGERRTLPYVLALHALILCCGSNTLCTSF